MVRTFDISTETYVDENDPCTGILDAQCLQFIQYLIVGKSYSLGQLIFFSDRVIPIKNGVLRN